MTEEQQDIEEIEQEIEELLADGVRIKPDSDFLAKEVQKPEPVVLTKDQESLFKALRNRDVQEVKKLVDSGVDVDTKDGDGNTPLILASSYNHSEMVELLLERDATINPEITLIKNDGEGLKSMEVIRLLATKYTQRDNCNFNSNIFSDTQGELNVAKALFDLYVDPKAISEAVYTADKDDIGTSMVLAAERNDVEEVKKLLDQDVEIDTRVDGRNALMLTTSTEIAQLLIEKGINIEDTVKTNYYDTTALMFHAAKGNLEMVKFLLEAGAYMYAVGRSSGDTAFSLALRYNNTEMLKLLDEAIFKREALIIAAGDGDIKEVKRLIKLGWDVNAEAIYGITALSEAILYEHVEIVKLLLEKGAHICSKSSARTRIEFRDEYKSINRAIQVGNVEIAKLLLECEIDIINNDKYGYKYNLLDGASANGHIEIVRMLIEKYINFDKDVRKHGERALCESIENKHFEIAELLINARVPNDILNVKTQGRTIFIQSVIDNEVKFVKFLIENGADLNTTDDLLKCTPLMWSVVGNNIPMAKLLIDFKANVNTARESDGMTALMFSMVLPDMTRLLIDSGADINAKAHLGLTALNYAQRENNIEIAKLLMLGSGQAYDEMKEIDQELMHENIQKAIWERNIYDLECELGSAVFEVTGDAQEARYLSESLVLSDSFLSDVNIGMFKALIKSGIDINTKNKDGKTVLDIATKENENKVKVIKLLKEMGAT